MTRGRYRWALAVVAVSAFMTTMDNTVVFTALPRIMADLGMSSSAKDWVATGYILMFSCLMITGGRLTDLYGCRVTFTTGMIVFTSASAVCGLAHTSEVLILARIVQGGGAALVLPATQVMVTVGRNDKQRSIGNIVFIGAASSATALGPTIGGIIVEHFHWGWIFLINIVPGILVILLGAVVLTGRSKNPHARIDLPGVLISATMLFAFIYGLEDGNKHGWADPSVLSTFALGAIALVCFIVVESWAPDPMIDLRFFRNRVFSGGLVSQMLYGIGFNGMMFYSQPFLQRFLGFSPPEAGLVMLPPALTIMVLTPVAFLLATKIGPRPAIGAGMALMGAGMILFSTLEIGDGYADLMPGVLLVGVGAALAMPLVMYVLKAVPEKRAGVASGVINVIREASGAFGIAIVGLLIQTVPDEGASAQALESFRHGTSSGLALGAALVLIGGVISALTLPSRRGWTGPKHGKQAPLVAEPAAARPEPALATATATATPRDPLPVVPGPDPVGAVPSADPVPAPIPLRTETDPMAAPRTPGPHWWSDTPDDDAPATWRPTPPDATSPWQDWADTAIPTWTTPAEEPPPPPTSKWFDDESAARSRGTLPPDDDPLATLPDRWTPGSSPLSAPTPSSEPIAHALLQELASRGQNPALTGTPEPPNAEPPEVTAPVTSTQAPPADTPAPPANAEHDTALGTASAESAEPAPRTQAPAPTSLAHPQPPDDRHNAAPEQPPTEGEPTTAPPVTTARSEAPGPQDNAEAPPPVTSNQDGPDPLGAPTTHARSETPERQDDDASDIGRPGSRVAQVAEEQVSGLNAAAPPPVASNLDGADPLSATATNAGTEPVERRDDGTGGTPGIGRPLDEQRGPGKGVTPAAQNSETSGAGQAAEGEPGGVQAVGGQAPGGDQRPVQADQSGEPDVPGGEPGDAWVAGRGGAAAGSGGDGDGAVREDVPEVGGPGWPPPPPDGWLYTPYVPEDDDPSGEPSVSPRSDAW
ncbi:DHA2 family efflux MFS transporter permease subunit [Actinomadura nitritigenes]|uniref:MFS transporter n=1 Tax=Actinomadura nitritigenes TaxID=134602 RepID=UPI003D9065BB